jgi:hypothetical protein
MRFRQATAVPFYDQQARSARPNWEIQRLEKTKDVKMLPDTNSLSHHNYFEKYFSRPCADRLEQHLPVLALRSSRSAP